MAVLPPRGRRDFVPHPLLGLTRLGWITAFPVSVAAVVLGVSLAVDGAVGTGAFLVFFGAVFAWSGWYSYNIDPDYYAKRRAERRARRR